jgi:hypothetical protein
VLAGDLDCSDAYVKGAFIYDDPNKQFITWEELNAQVDNYCALNHLPKDKKQFIQE